jgi:transcriptional regulator with XRE-family HTH domain
MTPTELKEARKALGLSAERFARLTGTSTGRTVRRWEAGTAPVPQSVVKLLELRQALETVLFVVPYTDDPDSCAIFAEAKKILALPDKRGLTA